MKAPATSRICQVSPPSLKTAMHMLSQRAQRTRSVSTVREKFFNPFVQEYVLLRSVDCERSSFFFHTLHMQLSIARAAIGPSLTRSVISMTSCFEPVTHVALKPPSPNARTSGCHRRLLAF